MISKVITYEDVSEGTIKEEEARLEATPILDLRSDRSAHWSRASTAMASSALQALSSIVVPAVAHHTATVIFAHGFGASSSDWVTLSSLPSLQPYVKWIFPQA